MLHKVTHVMQGTSILYMFIVEDDGTLREILHGLGDRISLSSPRDSRPVCLRTPVTNMAEFGVESGSLIGPKRAWRGGARRKTGISNFKFLTPTLHYPILHNIT